MNHIPARPVGDDEEAIGLQALWDVCFNPHRSIFRDAPGIRFDKNADGTYTPKFQIGNGGGGSSTSNSTNWNYRGIWSASPPSPYMTFDVVQLGSGTSAGMYLSTIDGNANSPDSGIGWVQISSSSGTWL